MIDPGNWIGERRTASFYVRAEYLGLQEEFCAYEQETILSAFKTRLSRQLWPESKLAMRCTVHI